MQGEYESSDECSEDDLPPGYHRISRATAKGQTTWQSHTAALANQERQVYRERSPSPLPDDEQIYNYGSSKLLICTMYLLYDYMIPLQCYVVAVYISKLISE